MNNHRYGYGVSYLPRTVLVCILFVVAALVVAMMMATVIPLVPNHLQERLLLVSSGTNKDHQRRRRRRRHLSFSWEGWFQQRWIQSFGNANDEAAFEDNHHHQQQAPTTTTRLCNGHANLCNKPVNEIMFATMHNANNAITSGGLFLPNHGLSIKAALHEGYRGINWDFGKCFDKVKLLHASCLFATQIPLKFVMHQILDFLEDNPNEVVIIPTEIVEDSFLLDTPTIVEVADVFSQVEGWNEKLYDHPGPGNVWPTLNELIDSDKRILYFFYRGESCTKGVDCPIGFHPWFQYAVETPFSYSFIWDFDDQSEACSLQRGSTGVRDFFGVNVFVTPSRFVSQCIKLNQPGFLRQHLQACKDLNDGLQPNLVLVNFWGIGNVLKVVDEINASL